MTQTVFGKIKQAALKATYAVITASSAIIVGLISATPFMFLAGIGLAALVGVKAALTLTALFVIVMAAIRATVRAIAGPPVPDDAEDPRITEARTALVRAARDLTALETAFRSRPSVIEDNEGTRIAEARQALERAANDLTAVSK